MNKPFFHLLPSLLICLSLPLAAVAQVVNIPDPNLRTKIEEALGKASGATITASDMAKLTYLEARNANISDVTGLEHAINLIRLDLSWLETERDWINSNSVSNLSPLSGLTHLRELNLGFNNISDLSPLSGLTHLTRLDLRNNTIGDLSALAELTNLRGLYLWNNVISDLSPLAGLTYLTGLGLGVNAITDISPIAELTNLTRLWLDNNSITDISALSGLTNLVFVGLWDNHISDISPLVVNSGLGQGEEVNVRGNPLHHASINTHVPALQSRGVTVEFDPPAPPVPFADVPFDVNNIPEPVPPPAAVRDFFDVSSFWQQWINIEGFPVLASTQVSPYAVKELAWLIGQMFRNNTALLKALAQDKQTFTVIAHTEVVSDIPEMGIYSPLFFFWNVRAGGGLYPRRGGSEAGVFSSGYATIHELAHDIHVIVFNRLGPTFDKRLETVYNAAMEQGLWHKTYAASDKYEYWAEGIGSWFHTTSHDNPIKNREALKVYDPSLALLIAEVFGDNDWRYTPLRDRLHLPHLQGFDLESAPRHKDLPPGVHEAYDELYNPAINERAAWVNLSPYDPALIPILNESRTKRDRTYIIWVNVSGAELLLYRLHRNGTETLVRRSRPHDDLTLLEGFEVGDLLLAKDAMGKRIAVFQAVEKVGRALVGSTPNLITFGLSKTFGDNQSALTGTALANPLVVEVRDEDLSVLEGIAVTFNVTAGDGTLSVNRILTDENGRAESRLTLGQNLGTTIIEVSANGIEKRVTFNAVAVAPVDIPDPNLRAAVLTALGKPKNDPITPSEMTTLTRLEAGNANIRDLTGLEFATDLRYLNLAKNSISDISALVNLTNLIDLALHINSISDPSPVADLTDLIHLNLAENSISDISALVNLTNLTYLELPFNSISDLSPLVANTGLGSGDEVDVRGNPLSYQSIHTHIPTLQSRGVTVEFDADGTRSPDVNGDGNVDVLDLIAVTSYFGNTGENIATDVSGDGVVDVLDLVLVAGSFDGMAAAPSAQSQIPEALTAVEVQGWLTEARALEVRDPIMKRGFMVLEQLLISLTPKKTELLANYPNPFNPETWIPYRLTEDGFVTLTIYDTVGQVVRTLEVGHQIASVYENRSKAIYWDGRNRLGEPGASGVYFYTLTAGDYSATRRMVILK